LRWHNNAIVDGRVGSVSGFSSNVGSEKGGQLKPFKLHFWTIKDKKSKL
jgi:hypothetical protein